MRRLTFSVTMDVPDGASDEEVWGYVENALASERGTLHPQEPMFHFSPSTGLLVVPLRSDAFPPIPADATPAAIPT